MNELYHTNVAAAATWQQPGAFNEFWFQSILPTISHHIMYY